MVCTMYREARRTGGPVSQFAPKEASFVLLYGRANKPPLMKPCPPRPANKQSADRGGILGAERPRICDKKNVKIMSSDAYEQPVSQFMHDDPILSPRRTSMKDRLRGSIQDSRDEKYFE